MSIPVSYYTLSFLTISIVVLVSYNDDYSYMALTDKSPGRWSHRVLVFLILLELIIFWCLKCNE